MSSGISRRYYPRSFLRLLLIAFGLVALPLVLAFVNAAVYLDRLADQSTSAVAQAAQAARGSRQLVEQALALERAVRQYLVLGDPELLKNYVDLRAGFRRTVHGLARLPLDPGQHDALERMLATEERLYSRLGKPGLAPQDKGALAQDYFSLSESARAVADISSALIDREIESLQRTAERAQRILWFQLLATIPLGLAIAGAAALVVARPIRELDGAIRRLGGGELQAGIRVRGPGDFEYLGGRLEWLRQRLLELEQQKQLFLRSVSHELKTPLTALREGAALLADGTAGALAPAQAEIAAILVQKSAELERLIEGLIRYHRAQSASAIELQPLRLDRVIEQVIEDQRLAARARGVRAELRLAPLSVRGDADKLRIVVDNLVSNAIKYSPFGGIISVRLARAGDDVVLEVADRGPGVAEEDREHLFEWFFRGRTGSAARAAGSGLGLAIAREYVLAHGGRIELADSGGSGACFRVVLPLAEASSCA